jgi:murein DD-endopeptidase MepM/ murein hydrolase activator NlpD
MCKILENGEKKEYNIFTVDYSTRLFMLKNTKCSQKLFKSVFAVITLFVLFLAASPCMFQSENALSAEQNNMVFEELKNGYGVFVDSKLVCILENESDAVSLYDRLIDKACAYYKSSERYSLLNDIQISAGEYQKENFSTFKQAEKAMGVSVVLGEPVITTAKGEKISVSLSDKILVEEFETTDFETRYEYTYGVSQSYENVLCEGKNGTVKKVYESKTLNGEIVSSTLILESLISEPINRVVEIGVTPSMQLASAELAYFIKHYDGKISSDYGYRYLNGYEFHTGVDLVAKSGSCYGKTAVAAADGVVVESAYSSTRGHYIIIEHEYGFSTVYMHFKKRLVSKGDVVLAGDPIGTIGSTGRSTGAHLHFEIRLDGKHTNPENYLKFN